MQVRFQQSEGRWKVEEERDTGKGGVVLEIGEEEKVEERDKYSGREGEVLVR